MINHRAKTLHEALGVRPEELVDAVNTVRSVAMEFLDMDYHGIEGVLWAMERLKEIPKLLLAATVAINSVDLIKGMVSSSETSLPFLFICYYVDSGRMSKFSLQVETLLRLPEEMLRSLALVTSLQYYRPGTVHC